MNTDDKQKWIPNGYRALALAFTIAGMYLSFVILGVAELHPLYFLNQKYQIGDIIWATITMWLCTGLFINAHDAMHGLILPKNPRINALVGQICLWLYAGLSYKKLRTGHILHHEHPSTADDPDYWPSVFGPVGWYFQFMWRYLSPTPIILVAGTYHSLVHVCGISSPRLIAMWIVPQVLSSIQLFYFGTYLPHRPGRPFEGSGIYKARSNNYPAWLSLLTCYHFGYHYTHHYAPWVPWWRLPKYRHEQMKSATIQGSSSS